MLTRKKKKRRQKKKPWNITRGPPPPLHFSLFKTRAFQISYHTQAAASNSLAPPFLVSSLLAPLPYLLAIYDSIRHSSPPISFVSSSWLSENKSTCHRHLLIEKFMYSADLLATGSVFFLFDKYTMMWETETSWSIHSNNVNTIVIYESIVCWRPTVLNIDTQHDSMLVKWRICWECSCPCHNPHSLVTRQ